MCFSVQPLRITDVTDKWELAERMACHETVHEQALGAVFKEVMLQLEKIAQAPFEASMKERVWAAVSKEKIKSLKEFFILEFCEKILGGFVEDEIPRMLEELKREGSVKDKVYVAQLQIAFAFTKDLIISAVVQRANSMASAWVPEIVAAVRKEGILLPEVSVETNHV